MVTRAKSGPETEAAARAALTEARELLSQWCARVVDARNALEEAEGVSGEEFADDVAAAAEWPGRVRGLRDQLDAAERASSAVAARVTAAEREWLAAHAAGLERSELIPAREALHSHRARTNELLAALEAHDGPYVARWELARAQRTSGVLVEGAVTAPLPVSHELEVAVVRAEIRHRVLVAMAQGEDPAAVVAARDYAGEVTEEDCYPDEVRADGVVPAPVYRRHVDRLRDEIATLEQLPAGLEAEIAELPDRAARERWEPGVLDSAVERRQARIDEVPAELAAARQRLADLTGIPA